MLSAGKYRPTMISVKQMKVKPPCFDDQFLFARDETTTFWDEPTRADEIVNDDRALGRYIRLVEIFGKIFGVELCWRSKNRNSTSLG